MKETDVLIIGAGQAGLACGYYLRRTGPRVLLADGAARIGDSWRNRYDSLVLYSPRRYSALPGLRMAGDPDGFPGKDEFADYLERYADTFRLPVELNVRVERLECTDAGCRAVTSAGVYRAKYVIIATGPFRKPFIPELTGEVPEGLFQLHSSAYRSPAQLPDGPAVVVGAGNSGAQIAAELAESRPVILSAGHEPAIIPDRILGKGLFFWIGALGLSRIPAHSRLSSRLKKQEPVIGTVLKERIADGRVEMKKRAAAFREGSLIFSDGSAAQPVSIIWATGFRPDYSWLHVPGALDPSCRPVHTRGVSPVPGLYSIGLPWLSNLCSGRINGTGRDARRIAGHIRRSNRSP